ncbi:MAG: YggS family pyridoxal phosphate-dependent enzyme [Treponema sp.]|nr:YggS family pyridoxal phosphate-dependent enzyme [Treponema sp.]
MPETYIKENISAVLDKIRSCEKKNGRAEGSVKLVAVSKFHSEQSVIDAIGAGQSLFGENRVQEAAAKFDSVREKGFSPELHIIGSLQRNKVKEAVRIASCIESVDRAELLDEIEKQCSKIEKNVAVLFEIHTGEESKAGFTSEDELTALLSKCEEGFYPHIVPKGFMTMAPNTTDSEAIRTSFRTLRFLKEKMQSRFKKLDLCELSMGMSGDFPIAIEEGSTMVRLGTAIFGERDYSK